MYFCHTDISIYRLFFCTFAPAMELQIYDLTLLIVGILNLAMAVGLLANNHAYRNYPVYRRSRCFTAVFFAVFGIGMLLHYHFQWRLSYPLLATALSVSYFHIAGVAITHRCSIPTIYAVRSWLAMSFSWQSGSLLIGFQPPVVRSPLFTIHYSFS